MGADFLETARAKAEEFLRELSRASGDTQGRAQGALDDLVVGGKKSTEQLVTAVRKEVQRQLAALGLGSKANPGAPAAKPSGRTGATSTAKAPTKSATTAKKSTKAAAPSAKKAAPRKATAAKKATKKTAG